MSAAAETSGGGSAGGRSCPFDHKDTALDPPVRSLGARYWGRGIGFVLLFGVAGSIFMAIRDAYGYYDTASAAEQSSSQKADDEMFAKNLQEALSRQQDKASQATQAQPAATPEASAPAPAPKPQSRPVRDPSGTIAGRLDRATSPKVWTSVNSTGYTDWVFVPSNTDYVWGSEPSKMFKEPNPSRDPDPNDPLQSESEDGEGRFIRFTRTDRATTGRVMVKIK